MQKNKTSNVNFELANHSWLRLKQLKILKLKNYYITTYSLIDEKPTKNVLALNISKTGF